jgi:histidinol-phosphate phosphatase family protein
VSGLWSGSPEQGPLVFQPANRVDIPPTRAAFLDRDGVLNAAVPDPTSGMPESPLKAEDVSLLPGAAAAARKLAAAGYALVCVSNQPAAAKGTVELQQLLRVHERVVDLLAGEGVQLQASYLCPHHPEGIVVELSGPCDCRKPAAGMLLEAASTLGLDRDASWMLGDTDADVAAGQNAGCRTVLIEYPQSVHKRLGDVSPTLLAADLCDGVGQLIDGPHR